MLYEEAAFSTGGVTPLNAYYDNQPNDPNNDYAGSTQYAEDGFVVVGSEYASNGLMMLVTDQQGKAYGVAFDDGDGNWNNELSALGNGLACGAGIGATIMTDGTAAYWTGAATAGACLSFIGSLGTLASEYGSQSSGTSYSESVTVFIGPHTGWDMVYTFSCDRGSWRIYYDEETQTYSDYQWIEKS